MKSYASNVAREDRFGILCGYVNGAATSSRSDFLNDEVFCIKGCLAPVQIFVPNLNGKI